MYEQVIKNDYLDKVVEMLDMLKQVVLATKDESAVKTEILVWHEGLKLRKVNREAQEGDYVRFNKQTGSPKLANGLIYGPVKEADSGSLHLPGFYKVYTNIHKRTPSTVEVFEVVQEIKNSSKPTKEVNKLNLLQSAEVMTQVSKEAYEKFKEAALESDLFKKLIKGIEESAESGITYFKFEIGEEENQQILDVFEERLIQAGYHVRNKVPHKSALVVEWGDNPS